MRRGTSPLAAVLVAGAIALAAVGVALAASPSPKISSPPGVAASSEPATLAATPIPTPSPKAAATPKATKAPKASKAPDADDTTPITTVKGVLVSVKDADGDVHYAIGDVRLSVGPPWFWGKTHPLADLVGKSITVTGRMDSGTNPNAKGKTSDGPEFDVYTVNGTTVRSPGKPPWAGGPKVVGERHPGYAGWSKNHGADDKTPKASAKP